MRKTSLGIIGIVLGATVAVLGLTTLGGGTPNAVAATHTFPVTFILEGTAPGALTGTATVACTTPQNATSSVVTLAPGPVVATTGVVLPSNSSGPNDRCTISARISGVAGANTPWVSLEVGGTTLVGPNLAAKFIGEASAPDPTVSVDQQLFPADGTAIVVRVHYDDPGVTSGANLVVPVSASVRDSPSAGPTVMRLSASCSGETHDKSIPLLAGGFSYLYFVAAPQVGQTCALTATVFGPGSSSTVNFLWLEYGSPVTAGAHVASASVSGVFYSPGNVFVGVISGIAQATTTTSSTTAPTSTTTTTTTVAPTSTSTTSSTSTTTLPGGSTTSSTSTSTTSTSSTTTSSTLATFAAPFAQASANGTVPPGGSSSTATPTTTVAGGTTTTTRPGATTTTVKPGATPLAADPGFAVGKPKAAAAIVAPVPSLVPDPPVIVSARKGGGSSIGKATTHGRAKIRFRTVTKCTKARGKSVCKKVKVAVKPSH